MPPRAGPGRPKGTPNKRTVARLLEAGKVIEETRRKGSDVVRARDTLSDLTKTATGFAAHWQRKILEWENNPSNSGIVPKEYIDRFMLGLNTAIRAATALAPYQDARIAPIKGSSPFDIPSGGPANPKVIEGKVTSKIDVNNPIELSRLYSKLVGA